MSAELSDADALRRELDAGREMLVRVLEAMPHDAIARRPPATESDPEPWTIRDVLWHLNDAERRHADWIEAVLRGAPEPIAPRRPRPAHLNTLPQLVDEITTARERTLGLLVAVDEPALDIEAPLRDEQQTPRGALAWLAAHDREHATQVQAILAAANGA